MFTKTKVAILTAIVLSFFSVSSFADFVDSKKEFAVYGASKIYEERHPVDNGFFMSQEGWMAGVALSTENYDASDFYTSFQTKLGYGQVDYTSAGTGTMTGISDYQFEGSGAFGLGIEGTSIRTTPYIGVGFRYLLNASGLKQSSTGHYGYDRESRYVYIPIGFNIETKPVNESYFAFRAEYDYFVYGQQTSYLSDISPNYPDITNDQEEGSGLKLSGKYHFDKSGGLEVYMDYWDIADSKLDISGNFMEPRNTTTELGLKFFWTY